MSTVLANVVNQTGPLRLDYSFSGGEVLVFALQPWGPVKPVFFGGTVAQVFDYDGVATLLTDYCLGSSWRLLEGCRRVAVPLEGDSIATAERFELEIIPAQSVTAYSAQVVHINGGDPQPL